ncbi:FUSC family protein [Tomitella gaofuii]|uniref:FUSC family protein n=1 Tax=Tomitella gaofuii TaxID=2760083 RepID=UPI0015FC4AE3|nr:FUSC family protein [Tomitella gaofuii]
MVGALAGQVITGMWIGLAALLLAAGEREGTYRLNFWIIAVSTPIAACGYLLGFAQNLPLAALIPVMVILAFLAGVIAGFGPAFSVAGMQFLLVSAIALGVPGIDWWKPILMYLVGGVIYAALLAVEMLMNPRRPQRVIVLALLTSLAELAHARRADLADGGNERTASARKVATSACQSARARVAEIPVRRAGSAGDWVLDAEVVDAAESVAAFLVAENDVIELASAEVSLAVLVDRLKTHDGARPRDESPECRAGGTVRRVDTLVTALAAGVGESFSEKLISPVVGREVMLAACRLALCYGIAIAAKEYFPFDHWFWVPLTVALIMKPDFGSVFARALQRVVGTVIAAGVATILLIIVPKGFAIGIVIGLFAAFVPWLMMRSYALQAVAITPAVILLVDSIEPGGETANYSWQRIGATAIGAGVVIIFGYLIWPHSRRAWMAETFREAMGAIGLQLKTAASPVPENPEAAHHRHETLVSARRTAYRALSDLQARIERALSEPPPADVAAAAWLPVASAADRLADGVSAYAVDRAEGRVPAAQEAGYSLAGEIAGLARGESPAVLRSGPSAPEVGGSLSEATLKPVVDDLSRLRALFGEQPEPISRRDNAR